MQLLQFFVVLMLFTACSSSDTPESAEEAEGAKTQVREDITIPKSFVSEGSESPPDLESTKTNSIDKNTSNEEGTVAAIPIVSIPSSLEEETETTEADELELIALEEESSVTTDVSALDEETISLEESPTEDQLLLAHIKDSYNNYITLRKHWSDASTDLVLDQIQVTNPELQLLLTAQDLIDNMPITLSQITQIEETLSEEGDFTSPKDRGNAEQMHEEIDQFVKVLSTALFLTHSKLAATDPAPSKEEADTVVAPAEIETKQEEPSPTATASSVEETSVSITAVKEDSAETNLQSSEGTISLNPLATSSEQTVVTLPESDDENLDDVVVAAHPENPKQAATSTVVGISDNEEASKAAGNETSPEQTIEDDFENTGENFADSSSKLLDLSDIPSENSFIGNVSNFFSGIGEWFSETTTSVASQFKAKFNTGWILEPTSLHIPNTINIAPEETKPEENDENSSENPSEQQQASAFKAIDTLLLNVFEFVQMNNIQNVEELSSYLDTPLEQKTVTETALLEVSHEIVQNIMHQTETFNASDFVKSSGYTSDRLSQEEIIRIVEIFSDFSAKTTEREKQQEELAVTTFVQ